MESLSCLASLDFMIVRLIHIVMYTCICIIFKFKLKKSPFIWKVKHKVTTNSTTPAVEKKAVCHPGFILYLLLCSSNQVFSWLSLFTSRSLRFLAFTHISSLYLPPYTLHKLCTIPMALSLFSLEIQHFSAGYGGSRL